MTHQCRDCARLDITKKNEARKDKQYKAQERRVQQIQNAYIRAGYIRSKDGFADWVVDRHSVIEAESRGGQ